MVRTTAGNCHGAGAGASKSHHSLGCSPGNHFFWANEDNRTLTGNRRWDHQANGLEQLFYSWNLYSGLGKKVRGKYKQLDSHAAKGLGQGMGEKSSDAIITI